MLQLRAFLSTNMSTFSVSEFLERLRILNELLPDMTVEKLIKLITSFDESGTLPAMLQHKYSDLVDVRKKNMNELVLS